MKCAAAGISSPRVTFASTLASAQPPRWMSPYAGPRPTRKPSRMSRRTRRSSLRRVRASSNGIHFRLLRVAPLSDNRRRTNREAKPIFKLHDAEYVTSQRHAFFRHVLVVECSIPSRFACRWCRDDNVDSSFARQRKGQQQSERVCVSHSDRPYQALEPVSRPPHRTEDHSAKATIATAGRNSCSKLVVNERRRTEQSEVNEAGNKKQPNGHEDD